MKFKSKKRKGKDLWDILHPAGHVVATVDEKPSDESLNTVSDSLRVATEVQR